LYRVSDEQLEIFGKLTLLQFIEHDSTDDLIVGATNTPGLLDRAIFQRFDDVLVP
jgi:hypothetical protein